MGVKNHDDKEYNTRSGRRKHGALDEENTSERPKKVARRRTIKEINQEEKEGESHGKITAKEEKGKTASNSVEEVHQAIEGEEGKEGSDNKVLAIGGSVEKVDVLEIGEGSVEKVDVAECTEKETEVAKSIREVEPEETNKEEAANLELGVRAVENLDLAESSAEVHE